MRPGHSLHEGDALLETLRDIYSTNTGGADASRLMAWAPISDDGRGAAEIGFAWRRGFSLRQDGRGYMVRFCGRTRRVRRYPEQSRAA